MKFVIEKLILWNKGNIQLSPIEFKANKVNVVTGDSNTGKTCILKIIDYCLFGEHNEVPDTIRENLSFYALQITINKKNITIGRPSDSTGKKYYFSEFGIIPTDSPISAPELLIEEKIIKRFFEKEYGITEDYELIKIGSKIKDGSKLKLQYFQIFNTVSQTLILDEENFFDFDLNKRDPLLYKEVLDSIIDLCLGLSTKEAYEIRKELEKARGQLRITNSKKDRLNKKLLQNEEFIKKLIYTARELDIVDDEIDEANLEDAFKILDERVNKEYNNMASMVIPDGYNNLDKEKFKLKQKIKKLVSLQKEVEEYKLLLQEKEGALKPVNYLYESRENLIILPEVSEFIEKLSHELQAIKHSISDMAPRQINVTEELERSKDKLREIEAKLNNYPSKKTFASITKRNITLIETRIKIKNFLEIRDTTNNEEIKSLEDELIYYTKRIHQLEEDLPRNILEQRYKRISLLDEIIQEYYNIVRECLGDYSEYKTKFDYDNKRIGLVKPGDEKPSTISGSSNYLFIQLCLFLGLHELFIQKKNPVNYVPQFLIIDYPSLPYKNDTTTPNQDKEGDMLKMRKVFELLNTFIDVITGSKYNDHFQMIILEHVKPEVWEKPFNLQNFHLVKFEKLLAD